MRMTIYVGGLASMFIALGLILAVGSFEDIINGTIPDPITTIFMEAFGPVGFKLVMAIVLISFLSCTISLQAAASRLMYSMGRDDQLPFSKFLRKFSPTRAVPPYALIVAGAIPSAVILISLLSENALLAIISFASFGIYLAFSSVVFASLRARMKGWKPSGEFTMGRWGWLISISAFVYQVFAMVIVVWPVAGVPWYDAWIVGLMTLGVVLVGALYLFGAHPERRSGIRGAAGDAVQSAVPGSSLDHRGLSQRRTEPPCHRQLPMTWGLLATCEAACCDVDSAELKSRVEETEVDIVDGDRNSRIPRRHYCDSHSGAQLR